MSRFKSNWVVTSAIIILVVVIAALAVLLAGAWSTNDWLNGAVQSLMASEDAHRETIDGLQQDKVALESSLTAANGKVDSLSVALRRVERQLGTVQSDSDSLTVDKVVMESEITGLRQEKETLESSLVTANGEIDSLTAALGRTERQLEAAQGGLAVLSADKASLESELATERQMIGGLQQDKASLESSLSALTAENQNLAAERDTLRADLASTSAVESRLTSDLRDARAANAALLAEKDAIERMYGRIQDLQAQIADLEAQREPLIPETSRTNPTCTGSMEPTVTCLDVLTVLRNFEPEDITVGAVIAFKPTDECSLVSKHVLHRVMKIKVEDGVYYYWPQGDNNPNPDNCWIPDSNVYNYVIEIHQGVRPENAALRQGVLDAYAARDAAKVVYEKYRQEYRDYCAQWDTGRNPDSWCSLSPDKYEWGLYLSQRSKAAFAHLNALRDYAKCWAAAARNVTYEDGQPVYESCGDPPTPAVVEPPQT